jgi:hypothetical protein
MPEQSLSYLEHPEHALNQPAQHNVEPILVSCGYNFLTEFCWGIRFCSLTRGTAGAGFGSLVSKSSNSAS